MHVAAATPRIVEALDDPRLLSCAHFDELVSEILPRCDNWNILARELVYRKWLTPFQMATLLDGRGGELILGSYVLTDLLGEGGMGRIYRAQNWKLGTLAAVKVIRAERAGDPASVERFLREVRALGAIRHPHMVHALDADVEGGRLYCAMEYVSGVDLGRLLHVRGALPIETAGRYASQLADVLRYIASRGLVHRDVKPSNVLVAEDGSMVKLLDLGLARFDHPVWEASRSELTQLGMMIGTPDYVSPEQIRDSHGADIRSDLYSLGCTFYHMLTGRAPFDGMSAVDKLWHHQTEEPAPVESLRPDVPPPVAAIVRTLLAKKPRDRYQDPGEVVAALRPYLIHGQDTMTDDSANTLPGHPVVAPAIALPRTEEIPVAHLGLVAEEVPQAMSEPLTWKAWGMDWMNRLHWLIAALIAGVAMGIVIGRG
jgi:eukaryotic-like serine/threonine-protein kinase